MNSEDLFLKNLISIKGQFDQNVQEKSEKLKLAFSQISKKDNPFEFIETISDGGIKLVRRVFDKRSNREIVHASLKNQNNTEKYQYSIINDAWVTSQLEHPNIPPIYEVGLEDDKPYFTMKLLKGQTLSEIIENPEYNFRDREPYYLNIILDICNALAYAHSKGILHLDIKADNIYIDSYNEVMLFDWGCALDYPTEQPDPNFEMIRSLLHSSRVGGSMRGTPNYMSPEQAKGNIEQFKPQTDIFLLGGLLYHLITKQSLYEQSSNDKKFELAEHVEIKDLTELNPKCSRRLISIVEKALEANTEDRYTHVSELAKDIKAYLEGERLSFEGWNPIMAGRLFLKQHPKLSLGIALSLALTSFVSVFIAWVISKNEKNTQMMNQVLTYSNQKQEKLLKQLSSISTISDSNYLNILFERDNLFQIDTLILFQPDNADFWFDKGRIFCSRFQFADAIQCFKKSKQLSEGNSDDLFRKEKSQQMLTFLEHQNQNLDIHSLSNQQLLEIISQVKDLKTNCIMFRTLYQDKYKKPNSSLKFLKEALHYLNPDKIDHFIVEKQNQQITIDLSNNPNLRKISPLFHFPCHKLNISNTPINRLYPLISPNLRELNISKTLIVDYSWLTHMTIHKLNLDHNQIGHFNLKTLPFIEELSIQQTKFVTYNANFFLRLMPNLVSLHITDSKYAINTNVLNYLANLQHITFTYDPKLEKIIKDPQFSNIHFNPIK